MNSQRLLAISHSLADELQTVGLLDLMRTLSDQLREAINSPSESTQRVVQSSRAALATKLREATSNSMSPGMRVDLGALKINERTPVSELIGVGLLSRLDTAFDSGGGYVSVGSLDQIEQLAEDIQGLYTAFEQLNSSAKALALRTEELEPGESVVGFTIPREAVDEELDRLQKEVLFFGRLISMVAEVVEGSSGDPVKVRSLQSSDFAIDLATNISVAAGIATAVEYLVRGLKKLKDIRGVKDKMQELGFEQGLLDELDKKGEAAIDAEIEEIDAKIFQDHKINDEGRVNELRTGISLRLRGLAARLERGYSVEVRTQLSAEPTKDEEQKGAAISSLSQVRFERTTPLLQLTDGEKELAADGEKELASPKKTPAKRPGRKRTSTPIPNGRD